MRRMAELIVLLVCAAALSVAAAAAAGPAQLRPLDLRVLEGDGWHHRGDFRLEWDTVPEDGQPRAIHYRLRNAAGVPVAPEVRLPWTGNVIDRVSVPGPGVYPVAVWLEGAGGELGPEAGTTLRFDDTRPGPARAQPGAAWFGAEVAASVRIESPAGTVPISGIRGYAVSVDRGTESRPCAGPDRCTAAEVDLQGSAGTVSLGVLPEGAHTVRIVAVSGSGMHSPEAHTTVVQVDATRPAVTLAEAPDDWSDRPVRLTANAVDPLSGMAASGPGGPFTAIAVDGGVPRLAPGDSVAATVSGEGVHAVVSHARDAAGNVGAGPASLATVGIDETAPTVAFTAAQDPADPERIEAVVADRLSGPSAARGTIALRPAGSRQRFEPLPTSALPGRLVARWDSDSYPAGSYELRATGYDLAGNAGSSDRRRNGARMVLSNPVKTPTLLVAGFGGRRLVWQRCRDEGERRRCHRASTRSFAARPRSRSVPYGRGLSFGGRLTTATGAALPGQPVRIVETFAAGAEPTQRATTVQSGTDGGFRFRLQPGPSRRVAAEFDGSAVLSRAGADPVRLEVLAGVRLRASSRSARVGGAPLVFSGSVDALGAPIPPAGRPVELQFKPPGAPWSEFRTVQTDNRGRFRYAYSFSDDDSRGVRFRFRAFAPTQSGWPYEPAASNPVIVAGR